MGIFFSILSPALYGISNYIDKFFLEKYDIKPTVITVYSGIFGLSAGLIVLFFTGYYQTDIASTVILLFSGFLTILYLLPYYRALSTDETSQIIPLFQFAPIFVLILSFFLLGEKLHVSQYIGAFLIIIGSFVISVEKFDKKIFKIRPAFWYMMLSSFMFALSIVLYKFGVESIPFWHTLPYEGIGMAIGALSIFLFTRETFIKETKKFPKKLYALMSVNEGLFVGARYTAYFALSLIPATIVNVLGGFQPLFVLLYGIILSLWFPTIIKEIITKKTLGVKFISIIIILIGTFLIFS